MATRIDDRGIYNEVYTNSEEYRKNPEDSFYYPIWNCIVKLTNKTEPIYELGCGSGQLGNLLIKNGRNYIKGWDYSSVAINLAKTLNKDNEELFDVKDIYSFNIGYFKKTMTVVSTEVLEHLDDDKYVIKLLSKGTRFIFSVPNFHYKTHRRIYENEKAIRQRYDELKILSCSKFATYKSKGKYIFVVDSIKNEKENILFTGQSFLDRF